MDADRVGGPGAQTARGTGRERPSARAFFHGPPEAMVTLDRTPAEPQDVIWMQRALEQARAGARSAAQEVPVGAVVVVGGKLLAESHNRNRTDRDPTAHAELVALRRAAARAGVGRLVDATLYVTLEPCAMCAGAMVLARINRLVYAAADPKSGMCGSLNCIVQDTRLNHFVRVTPGVLAEPAGALLREFFRARRSRAGAEAGTEGAMTGSEW